MQIRKNTDPHSLITDNQYEKKKKYITKCKKKLHLILLHRLIFYNCNIVDQYLKKHEQESLIYT